MSYFDSDCYCDYDPPAFYHRTIINKARRQHRCEECGKSILAGESYERVRALWPELGAPYTMKTCERCLELRNWALVSVPCFCWSHGGLLDEVREMVREVSHLVPGMFMEYGRRMVAINRAPRRDTQ